MQQGRVLAVHNTIATSDLEEQPMCGIMGYIGGENAVPILLEGLKRLEYRGYDSAGIAVIKVTAGTTGSPRTEARGERRELAGLPGHRRDHVEPCSRGTAGLGIPGDWPDHGGTNGER